MKFGKLFASLLTGAAIVSLAACGNNGGSDKTASSGSNSGGLSQSTHRKMPTMVLELMKNQLSKLLKKRIQIFMSI